jgi:hypothetical protein
LLRLPAFSLPQLTCQTSAHMHANWGVFATLQPIDTKDVNCDFWILAFEVLEHAPRGTKRRENSYHNLPMLFLPSDSSNRSSIRFILNIVITLQRMKNSAASTGLRQDAANVPCNPLAQ